MEKEIKKVVTITSSLEEKKELQGFLDSVKDKPLFEDKMNRLNEVVKELRYSPDPI